MNTPRTITARTICSRAKLQRSLALLVALGLISMNLWQPARATLPVQGPNAAAGNVSAGLIASEWQRMLAQIEQDRAQINPLTGEAWVADEIKKLSASDAQIEDQFGMSVAVSGDTALVGTPREDGGPGDPVQDAGAAYVYRLTFVPSDLAVTKTVTPTFAAPGQPITYTLSFSNTGSDLASNVVISDSLPPSLTVTGVTSHTIGAGVAITQTSGPPDLSWSVSDLGLGEGGVITLTALVDDNPDLLGSTLINTVAITGTDDFTPGNNTATAVLMIPSAEHVYLPLILREE